MKKIVLLLLAIFLMHTSYAQVSISMSGYPIVTTGWTYGQGALTPAGAVATVDSELRLTTAAASENGYVYYNTAENVTACGQFQVDFDFKIVSSASGTADGIAFFFEPTLAGFTSGGGLGLPSPIQGLVLTLDTYDNDGDGLNPEAELFGYATSSTYTETTSGTSFLGISGGSVSHAYFHDGSWHHVKITYNGGAVKVYLNGATAPSITGTFSITTSGYFGFSASTGAVYSTQYIKSVQITSNSISAIQGATNMCAGTTTTLTDSTTGGTWSSSAPGVASISTTGIVTSITGGTTTVTYSYGTGCSATSVMSVTPYPAAPAAPSPISYCLGATAVPLTSPGTGLLWYTVPTGGVGSATAPTPSTAAVGTTDYYVSQTTGTCESARATVAVTVSNLATPVASNSGPVCVGSSITVSSTAAPGDYYLWTGPGSFTATTQNFTFPVGTVAESGVYCVRDSLGGCASAAACTTVSIQSIPVITTIVPGNPTACFGSDGTITLGIFTAGSTYTVHYTTIPGSVVHTVTLVANTSGNLTITGLTAGGYTAITVISSAGCSSAPSGLYILTNAPIPVISPSSSTSPTSCLGTNGTITLGGLTAASTYTVSYTLASVVYTLSATANAGGQVIITGLSSGTYSGVTVNPGGGCVSAAVGPFTLTDPPAPVISSSSSVNPTTCISNDGTITLNGLTSGVLYTVNYTLSGVPHSIPVTANASGQVILTGLSAGTYTSVSVTNAASCTSATVGLFTLLDPSAPVISSTATTNPTTCFGTDGTITLNGLTAGVTYTTYYTLSGVIHSISLVANASGQVIITGLSAGSYSAISVTNPVSCSAASVGPLTLSDPPSPVISSAVGSGPTTCLGSDGTITLNGLTAGTLYTVTYTVGSTPVTLSITANASGQVIITGLSAGAYTGISVTSPLGCPSTAVAVTLTDPAPPVAPTAGSNSPLCSSGTLSLTATGEPPLTFTYSWTGPASFTSALQNPTITGVVLANAGTYTVTASRIGCTSLPGTVTVVVNPTPTITATSTSPTVCGGTDGTIVLAGGISGTSYTVSYTLGAVITTVTLTANASGQVIITGLSAGTYTSISMSAAGCPSNIIASVTLTDPSAPAIPGATVGTPVCAGGTLAFNGTDATGGVSWSWTGPGFATPNASQNPSIVPATAADAGTYTLTVTKSGCSSSATVAVVVNPLPTDPVAGSNSPVCSGSTIDLTATSTAGVTFSWAGPSSYASTTTATTTAITGAVAANAGIYTVTATLAGCSATNVATVSVSVNAIPTVASVANQTLCNGLTTTAVNFSGGLPGTTYTWTNTNTSIGLAATGTGNIAAFTAVNTATLSPSVAVISVTPSAGGCTGTAGTFTITVNPSPYSGTITGLSAVCTGSNITLSDVAPTGTWSASNSHAFVTGGIVAGTSTGVDTITYTVTNVCGTISSTTTVTVDTVPSLYTISGGGSYCAGGAGFDLTLSGSDAGISYQLYDGAAVGSPLAGTGSGLNFGVHTTGGTYTAIATNTVTGCSSTMSGSTAIVVNPLPHVYTVTGGGSYCIGGAGVPVGLSGSDAGVNYQLYNGSTAVGATVPGGGSAITFGPQTAAGTYTVFATNGGTGCINNMSGSVTIVVNTSVFDSVSLSTGNIDSVCVGTVVTYTATPVGGGTSPSYLWAVNGFPVGGTTNTYTYIPVDGDVVKCTMTSSITCGLPVSPSYTVHMTVQPWETPTVAISSTPVFTVCAGSPVTFTPSPFYGGYDPVYSWIVNGVVAATGSTFTYDPGLHDTVSVILNSNYACRLADSATSIKKVMIVYPLSVPVVEIVASPSMAVAFGQTVQLTALVTNAGPSPTYQWYINNVLQVGQTTNTFISSAFTNNDSVSCTVVNSGLCGGQTAFNWVIINEYPAGVTPVSIGTSDIHLFPNPNSGTFTLKGNWSISDNTNADVEITDMLGQVVYKGTVATRQGQMNEQIAPATTLASGVYLLNLHRGMENKVFHFVVEQQ